MSAELAYLRDRFAPVPRFAPEPVPADHVRFERIVRRHHERLRRAVAAMLAADRDRVDDVLQEAYLKAYRKLPRRFANEAHKAVWLTRVVHRCCLDELRRVRRRRESASGEVERLRAVPDEGGARLDVDRAFAGLSVGDRSVLLLVDLVGLDYESAARVLRVPRGTVASRLSAARGRFAKRLEGGDG
jgi:RNA polymerase sigma-70 factor, ECF subfamily